MGRYAPPPDGWRAPLPMILSLGGCSQERHSYVVVEENEWQLPLAAMTFATPGAEVQEAAEAARRAQSIAQHAEA